MTNRTRIGPYLDGLVIKFAMERVVRILCKDILLIFAAPNALSKWRYDSFSSKEPETLERIDTMSLGSVLWDIGANVGLYSIYATKKLKCRVWAFEPSVFNLELLTRNIYLNDLSNNFYIIPFALSDKLRSSLMKMTSTEWGALSTFGETYG